MILLKLNSFIKNIDSEIHHKQLELDDYINEKDEIERKLQDFLDKKFEGKVQYFCCYLCNADIIFDINWITNNKEKTKYYTMSDIVLDYKIELKVSYNDVLSKKDMKRINRFFKEFKELSREFIEKELQE